MLYDWFSNISFAYPYLLVLLLIIPLIIFWYRKNNTARQGAMLVTTTNFIGSVRSYRTWLKHFPFVLRCFTVACLVVALARPQHIITEQQTEGEGIDIILCFDISGSMTEKDLLPNRLQASKDVALDFVNDRPGDRIGVVIFSRQSFTLCPLTTDKNTLITQISRIQSGFLTEDGTAIGSGLATSVDRLRNMKTKSRIIILLTDGVDFGGTIPPDIAKEMAKLYGIKVYTIGVGSEKEIDEQLDTPFGKVSNRKKLEFNEALLKNIATETGGQYFHATDRETLQKIYTSINQLEQSKIEITTYRRFTEEFLPWVIAALALLVLEMVLRFTVFRKFP